MSTNVVSTEYSASDQRRLLRIAFGSCIGFFICKIMNWPNGVFFAVYPILLLGLLPKFDALVACEFILSIVINGLEIYFLKVFLAYHPLLMTLGVFVIMCVHFRNMAQGKNFMMWSSGLITLSVLLHFTSYPDYSLNDMMISSFWATVISVLSAMVLYWLIPEPTRLPKPPAVKITPEQVNHRMLMGAIMATLSFMVFQIFDLRDSLSAQVATILVLFPMTFQGSKMGALRRAKGVTIGVCLALVMQVLLYDWIRYLPLVTISMFITLMITARLHLVEKVGSGMGFGALTTTGILYGQYLQSNQDILFNAFYRLVSVVVALCIFLVFAFLLDHFLNRFKMTRNA